MNGRNGAIPVDGCSVFHASRWRLRATGN